jgi:hypothetical protein
MGTMKINLPEHLSSPPVFSGVRVTRSLVVPVSIVDRCLSFCTFSFGHCVVCSLFDIRILIAPLVSSSSWTQKTHDEDKNKQKTKTKTNKEKQKTEN